MTEPRAPAPPYAGEGPFALWHLSEDPDLGRFVPRPPPRDAPGPRHPVVWAVDTRHAPLYWFPRECPRGCVWTSARTSDEDRERLLGTSGAARVHVIEADWLDAVRACRLYAYELPAAGFARHGDVGGYWVSPEPVEPLARVEIGDLLARHATAAIELRVTPSIWPFWHRVVASTLEFSGCRLRNASRDPGAGR